MRSVSISSITVAITDILNAFTSELLVIDVALAHLLFLAYQIQAQIHKNITVFSNN